MKFYLCRRLSVIWTIYAAGNQNPAKRGCHPGRRYPHVGVLLRHLNISKPLHSYHIFNEHQTVQRLVNQLKEGKTLALVSDAGTPGISDPGFLLVRAASKTIFRSSVCLVRRPLCPRWSILACPMTGLRSRGFCPIKKGGKRGWPNWQGRSEPWFSPNRPTSCLKLFSNLPMCSVPTGPPVFPGS